MIQFFYMKKPIPWYTYFCQFYIQSSRTHLGHFQLGVSVLLEKSKTTIQHPVFVRRSVIFMEEGEYSFSLMVCLGMFLHSCFSQTASVPLLSGKRWQLPLHPQYFQRLFAWLELPGSAIPLPGVIPRAGAHKGWEVGNPAQGKGSPDTPGTQHSLPRATGKPYLTQLLHIWKLLRIGACLTFSFCPLSKVEI